MNCNHHDCSPCQMHVSCLPVPFQQPDLSLIPSAMIFHELEWGRMLGPWELQGSDEEAVRI